MELDLSQLLPLFSSGGAVAVTLALLKSWLAKIEKKVDRVDERVQGHGERIAACESENEGLRDRLNRCELKLNGGRQGRDHVLL